MAHEGYVRRLKKKGKVGLEAETETPRSKTLGQSSADSNGGCGHGNLRRVMYGLDGVLRRPLPAARLVEWGDGRKDERVQWADGYLQSNAVFVDEECADTAISRAGGKGCR